MGDSDVLRLACERDADKPLVLALDNDSDNLLFLDLVLKYLGFAAATTSDESHLLQLVQELRPKLLVLAVPFDTSEGVRLLTTLKKEPTVKNLPILAVTTTIDPGEQSQLLAAGYCDSICKPVMVDELANVLHRHLKFTSNRGTALEI